MCSIDLVPNEHADANVVVGASESWTHQADFVEGKVAEVLRNEKVDAVVCVAGGWAGGNAASKGESFCPLFCFMKGESASV